MRASISYLLAPLLAALLFPPGAKGGEADFLSLARAEIRKDWFDPACHARLALAYHRLGRKADAFMILVAAREYFGEGFGAVLEREFVWRLPGRAPRNPDLDVSAEAERKVRERLEGAPDDPAALYELASILKAHGDPAGAIEALQRLVAARPDDDGAREFLAFCLLMRRDPEAAEGQYRAILEKDPVHRGALKGVLAILEQKGDDAAIEKLVAAALARDPNHPVALLRRATAAAAEKKIDEALALLGQARESDPDDPSVNSWTAQILFFAKKDPDRALPRYLDTYFHWPEFEDGEKTVLERCFELLSVAAARQMEAVQGDAALLRAGLSDENPFVRYQTCLALGRTGDESLAPSLTPLLDDDLLFVREAADSALFGLGPKVCASLRPLLKDPNPYVRGQAFFIVGDAFKEETVRDLLGALKDPCPYLRFCAYAALREHFEEMTEAQLEALAYAQGEADARVKAQIDRIEAEREKAAAQPPGEGAPPEGDAAPEPEPE